MKQYLSIALLFIFSINIGGSYLIFKFQQRQIRREIIHNIKKGIPDSELTTIVVNSENQHELTWENDEEFRYNEMMYDVVHFEKTDSKTTVYYCLTDAEEYQLIADFEKDAKNNKKDKSKNRRHAPVKAFKYVTKENVFAQQEGICFSKKKEKSLFFYNSNLTQRWLEVSSPPPKQIL
ncbi:MAG: hypothetical protein ACSHW7_00875 [Patiriisocius sp.]|uniref:hypothetical protein n=1 Tax=Patiriisocius sp. TaxID=2822396 RepID=UPI003EFA19D0